MKKKTLIFTILAAALLLIIFIIFWVFGFKFLTPREVELKKVQFPGANALLKSYKKIKKYEGENFSLELNPPDIYITKDEATTTLQGIALLPDKKKNIESIHVLRPQLAGKFTLQFFLFLEGSKERKTGLRIDHLRGSSSRGTFNFQKANNIERCRVPLDLKKNDHLNFIIRGNGCTVISHPVFYKKAKKNREKNFVFLICADTLRYDHVGAYNPDKKKCTPNIDRLAKDCLIFSRAFSTSSWTLPAHMSLFTGLPCLVHNVNYGNQVLNENIPSLFEILSKKFICYSFNGDAFVSARYGFSRGFDYYREQNNEPYSKNAAKMMFQHAREFVENERHSHALFFLHTYQVHDPYTPEINLAKRFYQGKRNFTEFNIVRFINDRKALAMPLSEPRRQKIINVYDAGVFTFDYRFGQFVDYLKMKGLYRDSTIILFSDHGDEFMDHGCWVHTHTLYNELIKIPLMVKLPQNRMAGLRVNTNVSIMDILPALLELFDLEYDKKAIKGISLFEAIEGKKETDKRIFTAFLAPLLMNIPGKFAIISGDYKLIYSEKLSRKNLAFFTHPPKFEMFEMYNIAKDPYEKENLFKKNREKAAQLLKILRRYDFKRVKGGTKGYLPALKKQLKTLGYL
jgi:arylsulfatase A-like enzyme